MLKIKLNVGASGIWEKEGWFKLDHKIRENTDTEIAGDAVNIVLDENTVSTIFCSHMFEHIPHVKLEKILLEFNRVLEHDGVIRILTPDLKKIASAYANEDREFFKNAKSEDETIRTDLGLGGMFMNFIVSPGQDTALFTRDLNEFIAGYAHLYCYDFNMLKILFERTGFHSIKQKEFLDSDLQDYTEPLHIIGLDPVWHDLNQKFYKENGLVHHYDPKLKKYIIDFKVTGFDRDPLTSLIIEARKKETVDQNEYKSLNESKDNHNRYAWSLLNDATFIENYEKIKTSIKI
tara:strand:- start:13146 stop:14018 length:873 start_codon:yes stop_codon:yes gene_type:complete